ncbi:unnamed protein product [Rhizophagus irregularis]|nr:unnamed protein product [Rhizophagus irregularis]
MKLFVAQYRNKRIFVFSLMINTNTPKEKWVLSEEILKKVHYKGLSSLCLGLLLIRSSFRPFSLRLSLGLSSLRLGLLFIRSFSFFTASFHTNSVLPETKGLEKALTLQKCSGAFVKIKTPLSKISSRAFNKLTRERVKIMK